MFLTRGFLTFDKFPCWGRNNYLIWNLYAELKSVLYFSQTSCYFLVVAVVVVAVVVVVVVVEALCSPPDWRFWGCCRDLWCRDMRTRSHSRPRWCLWADRGVPGSEDPPAFLAQRPGWNTPWRTDFHTPDLILTSQHAVSIMHLYGQSVLWYLSCIVIVYLWQVKVKLPSQ